MTPLPQWLDPSSYDNRDLASTIMALPSFFDQLLTADGRGLESVSVSPNVRLAIDTALRRLDRTALSGSFTEECTILASLTSAEGSRPAVDAAIQQALHEWSATAMRLRTQRSTRLHGSVVGLFRSGGGIPKTAVSTAEVGPRGIVGDRQASRVHHGRPWQALCLWSRETIQRLADEGHPIAAGLAGENILIEGFDWSEAKPGTLLRVGTVVAEITAATLPCKKNASWFRDGNFKRMHHETEAGVSRMYAAVLTPGTVKVADEVVLEQR